MSLIADRPSESPPPRVLCAEDNLFVRQAMSITLKRAGYDIECVEDGALALSKLLDPENSFDLLITDQDMPNMTGLELVTELSKLGRQHKTIVVSGNLREEDAWEFRTLGVDLILQKPCLPSHVIQAVKGILG